MHLDLEPAFRLGDKSSGCHCHAAHTISEQHEFLQCGQQPSRKFKGSRCVESFSARITWMRLECTQQMFISVEPRNSVLQRCSSGGR